jgi:hypothetical protein
LGLPVIREAQIKRLFLVTVGVLWKRCTGLQNIWF